MSTARLDVTADGTRIAVWVEGTGPALVMALSPASSFPQRSAGSEPSVSTLVRASFPP
jgi:hypothetical protein